MSNCKNYSLENENNVDVKSYQQENQQISKIQEIAKECNNKMNFFAEQIQQLQSILSQLNNDVNSINNFVNQQNETVSKQSQEINDKQVEQTVPKNDLNKDVSQKENNQDDSTPGSSIQFKDLETGKTFTNKIIQYIKDMKILKGMKNASVSFEFYNQKRKVTEEAIQKLLIGNEHITIIVKTESDVYCIYFNKFADENIDDFMEDEGFAIYSLFRNKKQRVVKFQRKLCADDDGDDVKLCYYLVNPKERDSRNKIIVDCYVGPKVLNDKTLAWDEYFYDYYQCVDGDNEDADDFYNSEMTLKNSIPMTDMIIATWN